MAETKYEKLIRMRNNFNIAASRASNNFMIALWLTRAEDVQAKLDKITLGDAEKQ